MLDSRHKLPIKKVRLQDGQYDLYAKNRSRLEQIPKWFVIFFFFLALVGFVFYFDFFGFRSPQINQTSSNGLNSVSSSFVSSNSSAQLSTQKNDPNLTTSDTFIKILNQSNDQKNNQFCYLSYSESAENDSTAFIQNIKEIGWWKATSDCTFDLKNIAIFRADKIFLDELKNDAKKKTEFDLYELDKLEPVTVAAVFWKNNKSEISLESYVKPLSLPIFQDRSYFSSSQVVAKFERGSEIFFLDGRCQNVGLDTCSLWYKKDGQNYTRVLKSVFENCLNCQIDFAKNQPEEKNRIRIEKKDMTNQKILQSIVVSDDGKIVTD